LIAWPLRVTADADIIVQGCYPSAAQGQRGCYTGGADISNYSLAVVAQQYRRLMQDNFID
jgi:enoyl-[acyl-carrier-protein] reductase (NADH)